MIENTWLSNYGKVCAGMDWELFPTVEDAKVHYRRTGFNCVV